jgi:transcriptional regulator with XRE-family HTH domain
MTTQVKGLGDVLKRNRLQQKHVAEAMGVSRMTVWQWVHGRAIPTGENLLALAAYLQRFEPGIEPKDLVGKAA